MRIRIVYGLAAAALTLSGFAAGGTFTPVGATGGTYSLEECEKPGEPDLAVDPALKGGEKAAAQNAAVKRFNRYVEAANDYLECTAGEAERDLITFQNAVTATLEADQDGVIGRIEEMRKGLLARNR